VPERSPAKFKKRQRPNTIPGNDTDTTKAAIGFLETHGHQPFLLYLHYMDVHQYAYDEAAANLEFGTSLSDSYDAAIHWVDDNVAAVLTYLEMNDLFEKTLVVIASDHGEGFREHGLEGHANSLYQELTSVPLIFALPFRMKPGIVVQPLVRNVDLWPTVLDMLGLPPLPEADGHSLVPEIEAAARGEDGRADSVSYAYLDRSWGDREAPSRPLISITSNRRRLVHQVAPKRRPELFDHATDPTEQSNLIAERPDWVVELKPQLVEQLRAKPPWGAPEEVELDRMSRDLLKALGYVVR
jgi:arylsulfatase A-like enzyme